MLKVNLQPVNIQDIDMNALLAKVTANVQFKLKESGGKTTACCAACPAEVRIFGDLTDPNTPAYKLIHTPGNEFWVLKPQSGTLPNIFYMNKVEDDA